MVVISRDIAKTNLTIYPPHYMKKGVFLLVSAWCVAGAASFAQSVVTDAVGEPDENTDFTFTESQLNEKSSLRKRFLPS